MPVQKWDEVIEKKFPQVEQVDRKMLQAAARQSFLMRGSVRLMTGRLSTTEELDERRRQARRPLL